MHTVIGVVASTEPHATGVHVYFTGFAGNGHMDLSVAKYLADIPAPVAAFVIDCLPNMNAGPLTLQSQSSHLTSRG